MKPKPWSHSALECHANCPKQYQHKYVLKDLPPEVKSAEQEWGILVHQNFEWYLSRPGFELPPDLMIHKPYLDKLEADGSGPGCGLRTEQKVALSHRPFGPCEYFDKKKPVWWRGVIDAQALNQPEGRARIADYKTGKRKDDWSQLAENAMWMFAEYPWLSLVNAQFYWVQDQSVTKKVWARSELDSLVAMFADKLQAYATSFLTETWAPRQSGLCRGWCPVTKCQFWEPKREKHR